MTRVDKYVALTFRSRSLPEAERERVNEVLDRLWYALTPAEVSEANRRLADLLTTDRSAG